MRVWLFFAGLSLCLADDRALLVGVTNYLHHPDKNLVGIAKDLEHMQEACELLRFSKVRILSGPDATLEGIQKAFEEVCVKGVTPKDRVLFYFSGHGSYLKDKNGDEEDGFDEILCPADLKIQNQSVISGYLLDDDFQKMIAPVPTQKLFIFVDACHSGTSTRGLESQETEDYQSKSFPLVSEGFLSRGMADPPARSGSFASRNIGYEPDGREKSAENPPKPYFALTACQDIEEALATKTGSLFTSGLLFSIQKAAKQKNLSFRQLLEETTLYIRQNLSNKRKLFQPQLSVGNQEAATQNIFALPLATPKASGKENWQKLLHFAESGGYTLEILPLAKKISVGDLIDFEIKNIPMDGYLNIVNVSTDDEVTVLFPFQDVRDNFVKAGSSFRFSQKALQLEALGPPGRTLILAFHTTTPLNLYEEGASQNAFFRNLNAGEVKALSRASLKVQKTKNYGSQKLILEIE